MCFKGGGGTQRIQKKVYKYFLKDGGIVWKPLNRRTRTPLRVVCKEEHTTLVFEFQDSPWGMPHGYMGNIHEAKGKLLMATNVQGCRLVEDVCIMAVFSIHTIPLDRLGLG